MVLSWERRRAPRLDFSGAIAYQFSVALFTLDPRSGPTASPLIPHWLGHPAGDGRLFTSAVPCSQNDVSLCLSLRGVRFLLEGLWISFH